MTRRMFLALLAASVLLLAAASASVTLASTERDAALEKIRQLHGKYVEDPNHPGRIGEVDLSATEADDRTLEAISCLTEVTALKLRACRGVGDRGLTALTKMTALQHLDIRGCKGITDSGFQSLGQLKSLRWLYVGNLGDKVTGAGLIHLRGLVGLQELGLGSNPRLEDRHLEHLTGLSQLTELMLMGDGLLTDASLDHIRKLPKLKFLNLSGTKVTDAGLAKLHGHAELVEVSADRTAVTENGRKALEKALPRLTPPEGVRKTYGSAFLDAYFERGQGIPDAVKFRFKCEVVENSCFPRGNMQVWKIIFMNHNLKPEGAKARTFESNLYDGGFSYPHLIRMTPGKPSDRRDRRQETCLFLSIPDNHKDKKIGARTHDPKMFPTMDQEIDGFADLWKREQVSQANLTNKTISIEVSRGAITTDLKNWCVHDQLPEDTYRIWTLKATWDGKSCAVDVVTPDAGGRYYRRLDPVRIATEAFYNHPGRMVAYYWDLELQGENQTTWLPITRWKLADTDAQPQENTWGMKKAFFRGRPAIEFSNDGTLTYMKKGEVIELK